MSQEANHIDAAIADLEAWREQIQIAIQTLQHFKDKGLSLPSSPPPNAVARNGEIASDAFFLMTVPDAAEKYLKIVKTTKEIPEIAGSLLKGGLKSSSTNFANMVRTIVSRDIRFVKIPDGGWGLTEWYPAMRKEKKSKVVAESARQSEAAPPAKINIAEAKNGLGAAENILEKMQEDPSAEWTASRLAEVTGINQKTVQGTIFRLRHQGKLIHRPGGKGYVVASQA